MPRAARVESEGGIHHVTARGDHRERIFDDDRDRITFLRRYETVIDRHDWVPLTYCLMDNHVHLVVETPRRTLGDGVRDLLSDYAARRNAARGETGHIFQGRFNSRLVLSGEYFAQLVRYVALNPVAARMCEQPERWRWSGHRSLLKGSPDTFVRAERVSQLLEVWGGHPDARYARLFDEANPLALRYGTQDPGTWRPSLDELFSQHALDHAILAARGHGYRLREIAGHLGLHESTVSRWIARKKGV